MPELDLFVVHWNQPEACIATVQAFSAQGIPLRITVIDNDSSAEAYSCLQTKLSPEVTLVRLEENKGWGGALNVVLRGWVRSVASPYCLISAHDAMPAPDCIRLLTAAADDDPKVGIACPQYPTPFVARLSRWHGVYPEPAEPRPLGTAQKVDVPHGTLMLIRRQCLEEIGLFDQRYFAYGDEHGLSAAVGTWCLCGDRLSSIRPLGQKAHGAAICSHATHSILSAALLAARPRRCGLF
jgi:N-acetylglucosaminyl-diphospho-decaprenol L-rhamnosyltransferase